MRLAALLSGLTALLAGLEIALPAPGHWPPGTTGMLGVAGCVLIVVVAKLLGKAGLQVEDAAGPHLSQPTHDPNRPRGSDK